MARAIVVELPRTSYYTGDVIEGTVVVEASRDVSSRGLYVEFTGTEETVITRQQGKQSHTYRSSANIVQWRRALPGEGTLPAGTFRFPLRVQVTLHLLHRDSGTPAEGQVIPDTQHEVPLVIGTHLM